MGDLFLFAPSDLVRNNPRVSAGGRNAPGPATAAVRRKWVVRDRGWPTPPPPTPRGRRRIRFIVHKR